MRNNTTDLNILQDAPETSVEVEEIHEDIEAEAANVCNPQLEEASNKPAPGPQLDSESEKSDIYGNLFHYLHCGVYYNRTNMAGSSAAWRTEQGDCNRRPGIHALPL